MIRLSHRGWWVTAAAGSLCFLGSRGARAMLPQTGWRRQAWPMVQRESHRTPVSGPIRPRSTISTSATRLCSPATPMDPGSNACAPKRLERLRDHAGADPRLMERSRKPALFQAWREGEPAPGVGGRSFRVAWTQRRTQVHGAVSCAHAPDIGSIERTLTRMGAGNAAKYAAISGRGDAAQVPDGVLRRGPRGARNGGG